MRINNFCTMKRLKAQPNSACSNDSAVTGVTKLNELLVRPKAITIGADLCFAGIYFFPLWDLRDPSVHRREILHRDEKCVGFHYSCPNLGGPRSKILVAKT